jgi:hypothetical protein
MTTQTLSPRQLDGVASSWQQQLQGKTIRGVRPTHDNGPVPDVNVLFTDDTALTISVRDGVYFEGCLINTLRKSQPVADVRADTDGIGNFTLEIRSRTFPLLLLRARTDEPDEFPFLLAGRAKHD